MKTVCHHALVDQLIHSLSAPALGRQGICDAVFTLDSNEVLEPSVPYLSCTVHWSCLSLKHFSNEDLPSRNMQQKLGQGNETEKYPFHILLPAPIGPISGINDV